MLRTRDLRSVYRLLGEVRSLGDQPDRWPMYALDGIRELLHAKKASAAVVPIPKPGSNDPVAPEINVIVGPDDPDAAERLYQMTDSGEVGASLYFQRHLALRHRFSTVRRQDVISDEEFYADPFTKRAFLDMGVDRFLHSVFAALSIGKIVAVLVFRGVGEPAFSRREQRILKLFHVEMARMWKTDLAAPDDFQVRELTPRQKQVLWMLCGGESEQQVASRLGISLHTVHDHLKALHRHFGVSSRAELLVKVLRNPKRPMGEMTLPPLGRQAK